MYKLPLARSLTCDALEQRALLAPVASCHPQTAIDGFTLEGFTGVNTDCTFKGADTPAGKLVGAVALYSVKDLGNGKAQLGIAVDVYSATVFLSGDAISECRAPTVWTDAFTIPSGFCVHNGQVDATTGKVGGFLEIFGEAANIVPVLAGSLTAGTSMASIHIDLSQLALKFEDNGSNPTILGAGLFSSTIGVESLVPLTPFTVTLTDNSATTYTPTFFDTRTAQNPCRDTDCFNAADQAALVEAMLNYKPWAR